MGMWWKGARLVFERRLVENFRSKSFKVVTGLLLLLSAAAVVVPLRLTEDTRTYTLATVGNAPQGVVTALDASGHAAGVSVKYAARKDEEDVKQAVRAGDATVGLAANTLYARQSGAGTFPAMVAQAVVITETTRQLAEAGLSPQQVAGLQSIRPPNQVNLGAVVEEERASFGFAVGFALCMALLLGGTAIATTVAVEKSTRISEVLLAVVRPSQILVGNVLAVGTITLMQLLILGTPLAIAVQVSDNIALPPVAAGDIALAIVWFLLGFAMFAFLYAAFGALVDKVTDVDTAVMPLVGAILGAYVVSILIVLEDPESRWSVLASIFPITAPLAMPLRWISGEVPIYQLILAMALTAGTAVAFVLLASTIYRRALLITGHRVRVQEVIGKPAVP